MLQLSGPSLVAVATGIVGSAWASGAIVSISLITVPAAKAVPQTTAQVWARIYARGARIMPKVAGAVALSFALAAVDVRRRGGACWGGFAAAAACVVSIVPFTLGAMKTTNAALQRAAAGDAAQPVASLVDTWAALNLARGLLPLAGTLLGVKALLDNVL